jgi:aminomethyltransferase
MVVNAGCKDADIAHMRAHLSTFNAKHGGDVTLEDVQDRSLLALQGPKAAEVLQRHVAKDVALSSLPFMFTRELKVDGVDCWVTRCGYTGEDGFEVSVPNANATSLLYSLLKNTEVKPSGLGPRDSLRLEAGLCLYGHDLNTDITPIEAGLGWLIGKRRREQGGFPGFDVIKGQIANGVAKKRVGFNIKSGPPARGNIH